MPTSPNSMLPPDDPSRTLSVADPEGGGVSHVSVAGGTYTILLSGAQTAGRYCLIDMLVPAGGGPPPHRHDFEEVFTLLEGELEFTFRGQSRTVRAGSTINVPANAPHAFKNNTGATARMLCHCTPAGQEEFFMAVGFLCRAGHRHHPVRPMKSLPRKASCSNSCCRSTERRWSACEC